MAKKKGQKMALKQKVSGLLSNKQILFILIFALVGTSLLLTTHASERTNPAKKTYSVNLSKYAGCKTVSKNNCQPNVKSGVLTLSAKGETVEYVIKGVGPGRYNLDFSYAIPQVIGVNDYGYFKYAASGKLVKIGQPLSGQHHEALYGSNTSTSTSPLTATVTFISFGVKWPQSDVHIKVSYSNSKSTKFKLTGLQLRPQKSKSGWTNNKPSSDYKYYYPPSNN